MVSGADRRQQLRNGPPERTGTVGRLVTVGDVTLKAAVLSGGTSDQCQRSGFHVQAQIPPAVTTSISMLPAHTATTLLASSRDGDFSSWPCFGSPGITPALPPEETR